MPGKVCECTCVSEYMDRKYGKGKRFFNQMGGRGGVKGFRCASCAKEKLPQIKK